MSALAENIAQIIAKHDIKTWAYNEDASEADHAADLEAQTAFSLPCANEILGLPALRSDSDRIAVWMTGRGYATGHGDTIEDMLSELVVQARKGFVLTPADDWQLAPSEPTYEQVRAMSESRATDDEGEFPPMLDLLDFSGENKTHTVLREAYRAAMRAVAK